MAPSATAHRSAPSPPATDQRRHVTARSRYGSTTPRLQTPAAPTTVDTLGDDVVRLAEAIGEPLYPWQEHAIRAALAVDEHGDWSHQLVALLVARQNGKTHLLRMLILAALFLWDERLIIHTAQNREIALETFREVVGTIERTPWLREQLDYVRRTNGQEEVALKSGCRYKIVASTAGGARGLAKVARVILDEVREHKTEEAFAALTYTQNAHPNPQCWVTSNAGDNTSVVLNRIRDQAYRAIADPGSDTTLCWLEWSATPGCSIDDRDGWAQANPSLGYGMRESTLAAKSKSDPPGVFRTEALCQWVDTLDSPWPAGAIDRASRPDLELTLDDSRPTWLAYDVGLDRRTAALVAVQLVEDAQTLDGVLPGLGPPQYLAAVLDEWTAEGAVDELAIANDVAERAELLGARMVAYDRYTGGGVAARLAGVVPTEDVSGATFAEASDGLLSAIAADPPRVVHPGQTVWVDHMLACAKRPAADGGWRIVRRNSAGPIAAAIATAMALHVAQRPGAPEPNIIVV